MTTHPDDHCPYIQEHYKFKKQDEEQFPIQVHTKLNTKIIQVYIHAGHHINVYRLHELFHYMFHLFYYIYITVSFYFKTIEHPHEVQQHTPSINFNVSSSIFSFYYSGMSVGILLFLYFLHPASLHLALEMSSGGSWDFLMAGMELGFDD